jgi:hypothetical protein
MPSPKRPAASIDRPVAKQRKCGVCGQLGIGHNRQKCPVAPAATANPDACNNKCCLQSPQKNFFTTPMIYSFDQGSFEQKKTKEGKSRAEKDVPATVLDSHYSNFYPPFDDQYVFSLVNSTYCQFDSGLLQRELGIIFIISSCWMTKIGKHSICCLWVRSVFTEWQCLSYHHNSSTSLPPRKAREQKQGSRKRSNRSMHCWLTVLFTITNYKCHPFIQLNGNT